MQKTILGVVAAVVVAGGGWYFYMNGQGELQQDLGSYAYSCDNGSQFTMAPSADMSSVKLSAGSQGMFSGDVTLSNIAGAEGARYEGGGSIKQDTSLIVTENM